MPERRLSTIEILLHKLIAAKPISLLNSRLLHRLDTVMYQLTGGRTTLTVLLSGLPMVTLTTTGAKSGLPRTLPLLYIRDAAHPAIVVVIASNWGKPHSPAWYHNLKANPRARGAIDGKTIEYLAHEAIGEEYDYFWQLALNTYAGYAVYKARASNRHIPVMVLTPV